MVVVGVGVVLAEDVEEERAGVVVDGLVFDEELREQAQVLAVPVKERKKERKTGRKTGRKKGRKEETDSPG